jgi:hypothetical protein
MVVLSSFFIDELLDLFVKNTQAMSSLSKLNLGQSLSLKTLQNVASENKNQIVANEKKNLLDLKLWQIGLLFGVPAALVAFYLLNKRKQTNLKKKQQEEADTKGDKKAKLTSEQKSVKKDKILVINFQLTRKN